MNQLLETARAYKRKTNGPKPLVDVTRDEVELVVEVLKGAVSVRQYCEAINCSNPGNATHRIGVVLRHGVKNGWLKLELV